MKPKVGDVVRIRFLDHAENADDAMSFEVYGRITVETKSAYQVGHWLYANEVDRAGDRNPENEHKTIIVKKAIESIRIYK